MARDGGLADIDDPASLWRKEVSARTARTIRTLQFLGSTCFVFINLYMMTFNNFLLLTELTQRRWPDSM